LKLTGKRITVLPAIVDENLFLSVRNLRNITLLKVDHASTYDLIDNDILLFDKAGIMLLNEQLKN
jgi:ribosomal protein L4